MIKLTNALWIGDSNDEVGADLDSYGIGSILNVAQDLQAVRGWLNNVEYAQVGLIDGPGNTPAMYYAAVLVLHALLERNKVLVCCHTGGRSLAVAMMYLHGADTVKWDEQITEISKQLSPEVELPVPHESHKLAFERINWRLLTSLRRSSTIMRE